MGFNRPAQPGWVALKSRMSQNDVDAETTTTTLMTMMNVSVQKQRQTANQRVRGKRQKPFMSHLFCGPTSYLYNFMGQSLTSYALQQPSSIYCTHVRFRSLDLVQLSNATTLTPHAMAYIMGSFQLI